MSDLHSRGPHWAVCGQISAWCRRARSLVARLMAEPSTAHLWGVQLLGWDSALSGLQRQAERYRQAAEAGWFHPEAIAALMARAQQAAAELAAFLRQIGLTEREAESVEGQETVPIGQHRLPPLPYPYDALEPHIDERTMRLHHDRHHQSYVDGLNRAEQMMAEARRSGDFDLLKHWEREAAFNGGGHYLHTLFWTIMSPDGGGDPTGELAEQIRRDFGGIEPFRRHVSAAAEKVEGGGWAILVWSPRARRLEILQSEKHQNLSQWDVIPLLVLDVWEHAYYLKYQDDRKAYIDAWWNVVNWPAVAERFRRARTLQWEPA